jgi:hypothetical protein
MTEEEAERIELRRQPHVDAVDLVPDFVYCDEPKRRPKIFKPAISEREIQARAMRFAANILFRSRTHKAGQLRLLAARHIITGSPTVEQICRRMNVSKRQVQRALRFVRAYCGVPRSVARPTE